MKDSLEFRLRTAREAAGLSRAEVAAHMGVAQATIYRWEMRQREVGIDELRKLAQLYGTTVGWFMGESPLFTDNPEDSTEGR